MATPQEVEALIRRTAQENGAADIADVLVAIGINETGLSPTTPGDKGADGAYHSFGVFHENDGGRGSGLTRAQREDVPAATKRLIAEFRQVAAKPENKGKSWGDLAVLTQRPHVDNRPGYIQRTNEYMAGRGVAPSAGAGAPAAQGALPQQTAPLWPVTGRIISAHGQKGTPGYPGGGHDGIDIYAKAGTPVRSPVSGTVVANLAAGENAIELSPGYGRAVAVKADNGDVHVFGHGAEGFGFPRAGTKVAVGQVISQVGHPSKKAPGEVTEGEHLHWEVRGQGNYGNQIDPQQWLRTAGGTGVGASAGAGKRTGLDPSNPEYQVQKQRYIQSEIERDDNLRDYRARVSRAEAELAKDDEPLKQAQADLAAFNAAHPELGGKPPAPKRPRAGQQEGSLPPWSPTGTQLVPGGRKYVDAQLEDNPDYKTYQDANRIINKYTRETEGVTNKDKERLENNWKLVQDERKIRDTRVTSVTDKASAEFDADQDKLATRAAGDKVIIDSESGTILSPEGEVVGNLPRDAKAGATFSVPGRGTYIVNADGKTATLLVPSSVAESSKWQDAGDRLIEIMADGSQGRIINKGSLAGPTVLGGTGGPSLTIWDTETRTIKTIKNDGYVPPKPDVISAPKDAKHIVRQDAQGNLTVTDNPNYDPNTGGQNLTTTSGRVAHVNAAGKVVSISDTMTPEERAVYDQGKVADIGKTQADTARTNVGTWGDWVTAVKGLQEMEIKRLEDETWANVRKVVSDPNASADQVMTAIQAGAKNAAEWNQIFQTYISQRTQEEVARHNRVGEGVDIQNADRQLREGLYKDINETRAQRTNAQNAATTAIGPTIGMGRSMNILSAMAPQIGSQGVEDLGVLGYGVGSEAIRPVQEQWQNHEQELQALRDQMPSVRMANPNVTTPSFTMPRPAAGSVSPTPAGANKPTTSPMDWGAINKRGQELLAAAGGLGSSGGATTAVATATPAAPAVPTASAIGAGTLPDPMDAEEEERRRQQAEQNGGGGGGGGYFPRFRVPGRKAS